MTSRRKAAKRSMTLTMMGDSQLELIEADYGMPLYQYYLEKHGEGIHHFKEIMGAVDLLWGNENTLYTYSHKVDNMKDQLNKSYLLTQRQISEDVIKELKHKARKRGKRFF